MNNVVTGTDTNFQQEVLNSQVQQTAETYGIMSIPTLAIFKNGQVVDGVVGAVPKNVLKEKLNKYAQEVTVN